MEFSIAVYKPVQVGDAHFGALREVEISRYDESQRMELKRIPTGLGERRGGR